MKTLLRSVLILCFLAASALAIRADEAVNIDAKGVAIDGYDPVAFFTDHKPVLGDEHFQSTYHSAIYHFASAEHKAAFDQEPAKYAPQFGGFCAYGAAKGHTAKIDPAAFQIVDGRLLMQYNPDVRELFNKDQAGNLKAADAAWPRLSEKKDK